MYPHMLIHFVKRNIGYISLIAFLIVLSSIIQVLVTGGSHLVQSSEFETFALGGVIFVGFYINRIAPRTMIPSFVWALFAGMAMQPALSHMLHDVSALKHVMEICAAFVLFAGGLEIPFRSFSRWFFPIASLSLVGVFMSAILFALVTYSLALMLGIQGEGLLYTAVILGAILASTDPTAIIPTLSQMHFKRPFLREIAISESALTDITGSILTRFLLVSLVTVPAALAGDSVIAQFAPLLQRSSYEALALQIVTGILVGYLGYVLVSKFYRRGSERESHDDPALLFAVPIFTYALGNIIGSAGFLAAFVAGLMADLGGSLKRANHFYETFLGDLVKPLIFIVLGALVPMSTILSYAPLGIVVALLFIMVVRPLVVFVSLAPWMIRGEFTFHEMLFMSFVCETGIIAAVLLVLAKTYDFLMPDVLVSVGMWVILLTLVIEPPLTPLVARYLDLLKPTRRSV